MNARWEGGELKEEKEKKENGVLKKGEKVVE